MDLTEVELPADAHGFLQAVRPGFLAAGVPEERLHAELFAPNDWLV